ncbi:MAG: hypothetical protein K2N51_15675 [Lachnospiraceae bacterium]|nr:hypothetical protein [Lachnospiraceae bacterium]
MNENRIVLKFDNTLTNLAGYDYGVSVYEKQIKGNLDLSQEFVLVFPLQIKGVAASFVQGIFSEIVDEIGLLETEKRVKIEAQNTNLAQAIIEKLM